MSPANPKCSFEGCDDHASRGGLCNGHYLQKQRTGILKPRIKRYAHCTFPGCTNPHEAKGLCSAHRIQQKHGEELRPLIRKKGCEIEIRDKVGFVPLYGRDENGKLGKQVGTSKIDAADAPVISQFRWSLHAMGRAVTNRTREDKTRYVQQMHQLIMQPPPDMEIDHINGDPLDNRRENLRIVTHAQNMQNRGVRSESRTGARGVYVAKQKTPGFRAEVAVGGQRHYLGTFRTREEADAAASTKREELMSHTNESRRRQKKSADQIG